MLTIAVLVIVQMDNGKMMSLMNVTHVTHLVPLVTIQTTLIVSLVQMVNTSNLLVKILTLDIVLTTVPFQALGKMIT
jgi:hypothetical protein